MTTRDPSRGDDSKTCNEAGKTRFVSERKEGYLSPGSMNWRRRRVVKRAQEAVAVIGSGSGSVTEKSSPHFL